MFENIFAMLKKRQKIDNMSDNDNAEQQLHQRQLQEIHNQLQLLPQQQQQLQSNAMQIDR